MITVFFTRTNMLFVSTLLLLQSLTGLGLPTYLGANFINGQITDPTPGGAEEHASFQILKNDFNPELCRIIRMDKDKFDTDCFLDYGVTVTAESSKGGDSLVLTADIGTMGSTYMTVQGFTDQQLNCVKLYSQTLMFDFLDKCPHLVEALFAKPADVMMNMNPDNVMHGLMPVITVTRRLLVI